MGQVYEGRGRSLLLSSSRNEARLWDVGACSDRAGGAWTPAEYVTEPLHTCGGMRNAIFRPDGRMVPPHASTCTDPFLLLRGNSNPHNDGAGGLLRSQCVPFTFPSATIRGVFGD